jgi:hypothetical protein
VKFEYQAIDEDGGVIRGIIKASNAQKVLQILLHKKLHPLDIRQLTESTVEISRLHCLKMKLQGHKPESRQEMRPEVKMKLEELKEKPKSTIDWTYVIFLLLMLGVLAASAL